MNIVPLDGNKPCIQNISPEFRLVGPVDHIGGRDDILLYHY